MERSILHCDMNNFFASVECRKDPTLRDKPVAVCGDREERHGIVLAKNEIAKRYGIVTGEPTGRAQSKCPSLVIVPPHYDDYLYFSARAREIYARYTDLVEPFGADECWLDVTGSQRLFGEGRVIAEELRRTVERELGLTISVGVSFNKVFAKLGSDMKKPNAVTCVPASRFREIVWKLPTSDLLGVGRTTAGTLASCGIYTIGQLAQAYPPLLKQKLGKNGLMLKEAANGRDEAPVLPLSYEVLIKSVSHGTTTRRDMTSYEEVWPVLLGLSEEIGHRLLSCHKRARGVSLSLRDNRLQTKQLQTRLAVPTDSYFHLAKEGFRLMQSRYHFDLPLRSISIGAIDLCEADTPYQQTFFCEDEKLERREALERVMEGINLRYGQGKIRYGILFSPSGEEIGRGFGFGRREELH